ncbi:MAG: beta-propeller domain-containing protein [Myxococcales bacterium]|nr:beta-propeller domain-containing protein [Myxococcota bacterium]MDW8280887.1 beta-propeller domain-containing protein [Myxococcales bacterium]
MNWKHCIGLALAGTLGAGCQGSRPEGPEPIQNRLTLQNFQSCQELEQYIEDTAVRKMRQTLDSYYNGLDRHAGVGAGPESSADGSNRSSGPAAYTTTNTQVAGVDEADFVKNDGTRIFVLSGGTLYAARSWPPENMALVSKLKIEGYPSQMYLDDKNRVVVFSSVYTEYPWYEDAKAGRPCLGWDCGYYASNTTKVTVVDVSNLAAPKVTDEYYLPGHYVNSRRIGSSVRLVLSDHFRWPAKVRFYPEYAPGLWEDKNRLAAALEELKANNEVVIRGQTLEQWLPRSRYRNARGELVEIPYNCSDFARSNAPVELGLLTIATVNLDRLAAAPSRTSIVGEAGEIYASTKNLYVANRHWWWWPEPGQKDYTYLHKFDITDPDRAVYVASGGVDGHIVDQFSMDENSAGYFRVATTIATRVPDERNPQNRWGRIETVNRISVLREDGGQLVVVGRTEDLAKGERIFSARFVEDKAYVVTFRNIDPFFTFDLSDPRNPRQVGELKIPGFSTYIHPIDKNHVLTIGTYLPEPDAMGQVDWRQRRLQLSLFDVSDFARPVQKFTHVVGTAHGWSEAQYEHKAFNYFPARKLLAIPFWDYNFRCDRDYWSCFTSDVRVFRIDTTTGIQGLGALSMKDVYQVHNDREWTWYWTPYVRRSVMASSREGQDYVYAISDAGVRVANLERIATPLSTVLFEKEKARQ